MSIENKTTLSSRAMMVAAFALSIMNISTLDFSATLKQSNDGWSESTLASTEDFADPQDTRLSGTDGSCNFENDLGEVDPKASSDNLPKSSCNMEYTKGLRTIISGQVKAAAKVDKNQNVYYTLEEIKTEVDETEAEDCEECRIDYVTSSHVKYKSLDQLRDAANRAFTQQARKHLKSNEIQKKIAKGMAECKLGEDGRGLTPELQKECVIEKLMGADLEEKDAKKLYNARLKGSLENMVKSGDEDKIEEAQEVLERLSASTYEYVAQSAKDMLLYSMAKQAMASTQREIEMKQQQLSTLAANDPRRQMIQAQLNSLTGKMQWQAGQASKYMDSRMNQMYMSPSNNYAQSLLTDLQKYQSDLSSSLNTVIQDHNNLVNPNNGSGQNGGNQFAGNQNGMNQNGMNQNGQVPNNRNIGLPRGGSNNMGGQNGIPNVPGGNGQGAGNMIPQVGSPANGQGGPQQGFGPGYNNGQSPMGRPPMYGQQQPPFGQPQQGFGPGYNNGQPPMGRPPMYGQQQPPYGQSPYGQSPYGQSPYGRPTNGPVYGQGPQYVNGQPIQSPYVNGPGMNGSGGYPGTQGGWPQLGRPMQSTTIVPGWYAPMPYGYNGVPQQYQVNPTT